MKTLQIIISCSFLILMSQICFAQKHNMGGMLSTKGSIGIYYEPIVYKQSAVLVSIMGQSDKEGRHTRLLNKDYFDYTNKGTDFRLEYRYYLEKNKGPLNGFYMAAHYAYGKHTLTHLSKKPPPELGPFEEIFLAEIPELYIPLKVISIIGSSDHILVESKVNIRRMGLGMGYKIRKGIVTFDMGANFSVNKINSDQDGVPLPDGNYEKFRKDVNGTNFNLYLGVGCAF